MPTTFRSSNEPRENLKLLCASRHASEAGMPHNGKDGTAGVSRERSNNNVI